MLQESIVLRNISVIRNGKTLLGGIFLTLNTGEQWAITGPAGSGKTLLTLALTRELQHSGEMLLPAGLRIERVSQQHQFLNRSHTHDFYYQQRFQSQDAEDAITVAEALQDSFAASPDETERLLQQLHLTDSLEKPLIQLSNGENKRLQLIRALIRKPQFLILDNPFTGLDTDGRKLLHRILDELAATSMRLLVICPDNEFPASITHVLDLEAGRMVYAGPRNRYTSHSTSVQALPALRLPEPESYPDFEAAVRMVQVNIAYERKHILRNINWEVKKGSCWLVSGPNGAGKSTLLSLITGDNPQAYANEIYLFDKRKGKGESIWDIKKRIGYVSPELHLFFEQHIPVWQVIGSGLFDTVGLFRQLSKPQKELTGQWLDLLGLTTVQDKSLNQLSSGQQRMALLARALVKTPPLLILDEPCQGLDSEQTRYFNAVVDQLHAHYKLTLIYVSHYSQQIPACINQYFELDAGAEVK